MKTVIFKWNPSFSSYTMRQFLSDLEFCNESAPDDFDWSVWDYEQIHEGDRYYWDKLGYGATGIVSRGIITSEPRVGEDWSGKGRKTYYVDFEPEMIINPDALPILTMDVLKANIPDFEWDHGHSGLILTDDQAVALDKLWDNFVETNREELKKKANSDREYNDYIYWQK